ncbi:MAG: hypothetical protein LBS41_00450 [Streptococcaceae bacterium]|jgi:hypothetical protein|nr:hypothetical protein [Streptococcaceae bacterium]
MVIVIFMGEKLMWHKYNEGLTIGLEGSEGGIILKDDESTDGARITLESIAKGGPPFVITCGIYGMMFTTVFHDLESDANSDFKNIKALINLFFSGEMSEEEWHDMFWDIY